MYQKYQERQTYKRYAPTLNTLDSDVDYNLQILTIYLDVKFSCSMKIQHGSQHLIGQIATNTHQNNSVNISKTSKTQITKKKFIVNGQLYLKSTRGSDIFEITLHLQTDKGGNYFAGVIKLKKHELQQIGNDIVTYKIEKCLDPEAYCEAKVQQVSQRKTQANIRSGSKADKLSSPKSQVKVDIPKKQNAAVYGSPRYVDYQSKVTPILKPVTIENIVQDTTLKSKEIISLQEQTSNKSSRISKKQTSNQTLRQNTSKLKQLEIDINNLMNEKPQKAVIDELLKQKAERMNKLQDKIKELTNEKQQLEKKVIQIQNQHQKQVQLLKKSSMKNPSLKSDFTQITRKLTNLEQTNKELSGKLGQLTKKLTKMQQQLKQKDKQHKNQLESKQRSYNQNLTKLNKQVSQLNIINAQLQKTIETLQQMHHNELNSKISLQQDNLTLTQQIQKLQTQIQTYRQSSPNFQIQLTQKSSKEQSITKIVQCENCKEFQQLLQNQQRRNLELEKSSNEMFEKNLDLEKQLAMVKLQDQRNKFQIEQWKEEGNELKEKEKILKEQIKDMEEHISSLENKLEVQRQKFQLKDLKQQSLRQQSNQVKTSTTKLRQSFQQLQLTHGQIVKQRDGFAFECEKLKMKYKVLEQKIQTLNNDNRQRQNAANEKISKYEKEVLTLKSKINSMLSNGQDLNERIHSKELQNLKYQIEVQNYQNQLKELKDRLQRSEHSLKEKEDEIYQLQSSLKQKQLKMEHLKEDLGAARAKYTQISGHLNNNSKMIQMVQSQSRMYKNQLQEVQQLLEEKKKQETILKQNIALIEDEQIKITRSYANLQFQFVQYKNNVLDMLLSIPVFEHGHDDKIEHHQHHQFQDLESSFIMDLPITHFTINAETPLSDIKKYLLKYIQENSKNSSLLMEQNHILLGQNKNITEEFAKIAQNLHKKQEMLHSARKQFAQETQQLKNKHSTDVKNYEESLKNTKKDLIKLKSDYEGKGKQLQSVKSSKEQQKKNHDAIVSQLTLKYEEKINQLKMSIEQMQATLQFINLKNNSILQTKKSSQKEIDLLRKELMNEKLSNQKKIKQISDLSTQLSKYKSQVQSGKNYKAQTTKRLKQLQLQLHLIQTKSLQKIERLQQSIKSKQKTITQYKLKIENFYKQKQLSSKSEYEKQNKILILQQKFNRLENQKDDLSKKYDMVSIKYNQSKEIVKENAVELKEKEKTIKQLQMKQEALTDCNQKLERLLEQRDNHITKLEERNLEQIQQFNKKKNQMLNNLQEESQKSVKAIGEKNLTVIQLENSLNKLMFEQKKVQEINHSLQQQIYVQRHKVMERDSQIQTLTARRDELEQREEQLESMYCKLAEQTRQKQEKLFSLSSRVYELEAKLNQSQKSNKEAIDIINTRWEVKLKKITDEYQTKLAIFDGRPKIQSYYDRESIVTKQKDLIPQRDQSPIRQIQTYFEEKNEQVVSKPEKVSQSFHQRPQRMERLQKHKLETNDDIFSKNLASLKPNYFKRTVEPKSINYRRIQRFRSEFE